MARAFDNLQSCVGYSGGKCRLMFRRKLKVVMAGIIPLGAICRLKKRWTVFIVAEL
jgi:hypothetical protein